MVQTLLKLVHITPDIPAIWAVQLADKRVGATLRSLCQALSLDYSAQWRHLHRKHNLASALVTTTIPTRRGERTVIVLLAWAIPILLVSLESSRMPKEKQALITVLQEKAVRAI